MSLNTPEKTEEFYARYTEYNHTPSSETLLPFLIWIQKTHGTPLMISVLNAQLEDNTPAVARAFIISFVKLSALGKST
jgi:hypothetical protein